MPRSPGPPSTRSRHRRRHADAVIQAEVRRLARALSVAVEAGTIKRPPAEFYASGDPAPEPALPRGS